MPHIGISKSFTFLRGIGILTLLFMFGCKGGCDRGSQKEEGATQEGSSGTGKEVKSAIQPPIPEADPPYTEYSIDPTEDTTIRYRTGTRIHIPSEAFLTQEGKVVKEMVTVRYREMHDPIGFFAAGVPMTIEKNGEEKVFESAGMCDMRASLDQERAGNKGSEDAGRSEDAEGDKKGKERDKDRQREGSSKQKDEKEGTGTASAQNGEMSGKGSLKVNPESKIKVEMASEVEGDFPVYTMDESSGEWEQTSDGPGDTASLPDDGQDGKLLEAQGETGVDADLSMPDPSQLPSQPPKPTHIFSLQKLDMKGIDIDESSYEGGRSGRLKKIKNADKGVLKEHPVVFVQDKRAFRSSARMDRISTRTVGKMEKSVFMADRNTCQLPRFVSGIRVKTLSAQSDLYKLTAYLDEKGGESVQCVCTKHRSVDELRSTIKKEWAQYLQALQEYQQKKQRVQEKKDSIRTARNDTSAVGKGRSGARQMTAELSRVFEIQDFGFTNCDSPEDYPTGASITVNAKTEDGKSLIIPTLRIATMDPKMLINWKSKKEIQYDPEVKTLLWGVTDNGALAYYPPEEFAKIAPSKGAHDFHMKVKEEIDSYEELRKTLLP